MVHRAHAMPVVGAITLPGSPDDAGGRIPFGEIESAAVRDAIAFWQGLCRGRRFPSRGDIRPREVRGLLRNICLIRVLDGGSDYEYRVIGDAHVIAYGFSMQGKRLSEIDSYAPGHGQVLKRLYDRVVRKGEPFALRGWIEQAGVQKKYIYSESLFGSVRERRSITSSTFPSTSPKTIDRRQAETALRSANLKQPRSRIGGRSR